VTRSGGRILVVEDDPSILMGVRMNLEGEGYEVTTATDGQEALERIRAGGWDLVVLDLMLPRRNGYEIISDMRRRGDHTPIVVLSARTAETDTVMGLDLGADDYVTKPFSVAELLARVRAALRRRSSPVEPDRWTFGDVEVDPARRRVRRAGLELELTATEFDVLVALLEARGRALTRRQIMDRVWGAGHHGTERTVDNFVVRLRSKLEADSTEPSFLVTVRGVGYRLDVT
jgi:DNA-binding response OmpR family regulator